VSADATISAEASTPMEWRAMVEEGFREES